MPLLFPRFVVAFLQVARHTCLILVLAMVTATVLAVGFYVWQQERTRQAWFRQQEQIAQSDLEVLQQLSAKKIRFDELSKLARGELLQEKDAADSASFLWSSEPNGYWKLRATLPGQDGNRSTLVLVRRISNAELLRSKRWDLGIATVLFSSVMLNGIWVAWHKFQNSERSQSLMAWANMLDEPTSAPKLSEAIGRIEACDAELAVIANQASIAIQQRMEEIERSSDESTRIMAAMPVGVVVFDPSLRFLFSNTAAREWLGISDGIALGQPLVEVMRLPTVLELIQQTWRSKEQSEAELENPLNKTSLRIRAHPWQHVHLPHDASSPVGVLLTVTDETRLRQLENMRRDFTANVSHELKTPLSAIKAYAETLLMGAIDDKEMSTHFVQRIGEQSNRLEALIRDLMQLTRLQSQPTVPTLVPIVLYDALATCVEEHRTIGNTRGVSIDMDGVDPSLQVQGDLESLRTILDNLLGNAVRYNRENGWVNVSTLVVDNRVILEIRDSGIGIPPEDLDRIFERFYRVDKARSQETGGTGLGLSIVKHLVNSLAAEIEVKSQLGVGSTFRLIFSK
jgi:two-component system, OmpR family, phosphate regulon sensor histidine kinase PhoR